MFLPFFFLLFILKIYLILIKIYITTSVFCTISNVDRYFEIVGLTDKGGHSVVPPD